MSEISGYLTPGERVIWEGRPWRGPRLEWRDLFLIPFSLMWCGLILIFFVPFGPEPTEPTVSANWIVIGLIFLGVAAYFLVGRFLHDIWIRSRTRYALTDRRVLIRRGRNLTSLTLDGVTYLDLAGGRGGGRGSIAFSPPYGTPGFLWFYGLQMWVPSLGRAPQLYRIERARWVFDQILIAKGETPPSS